MCVHLFHRLNHSNQLNQLDQLNVEEQKAGVYLFHRLNQLNQLNELKGEEQQGVCASGSSVKSVKSVK